jgi:hypothetical protein
MVCQLEWPLLVGVFTWKFCNVMLRALLNCPAVPFAEMSSPSA